MTILEALQEKGQIWEQLQAVRSRRGKDGALDQLDQEQLNKLNARYNSVASAINDLEIEERQQKEMVSREAEARNRDNKATSTGGPTYDEAFWRYMVRNKDQAIPEVEMRLLETRGTNTQIGSTDSLGGYTIPRTQAERMETMMKWYGGWSAFGTIETNFGGQYRMPSLDDTSQSGAVIAQGVDTTVNDLTFGQVLWGDYTIDSKVIKLGRELMNDNSVGLVQQTLGEILPERLGRAVNNYLTNGTGTGQPYGLTTTVTNASLTTAGATAITKAELIKALHGIDKAYRSNPGAGWMMHDTILAYLRTLDVGNTDTVQIFTPSLVQGEPDRLLGLPIYVNNDLEAGVNFAPVATKKHIYVGDFQKYKVRRIGGITLERNDSLYWTARTVGFMGFLRMDGNLTNANAIKYIGQHA
jgi:HK97 family phage major capsid protein